MSFFRSKHLLTLMLSLAVILQLLTPFLHAHTGVSSQKGLHLHVASTGFEAAVASESGKMFISGSSDESPEVGVPASRQVDPIELIVCVFYVLALFGFTKGRISSIIQPFFDSVERFAHQRFTQNSLPISLAPPTYL